MVRSSKINMEIGQNTVSAHFMLLTVTSENEASWSWSLRSKITWSVLKLNQQGLDLK
jgi:hypothetical protein